MSKDEDQVDRGLKRLLVEEQEKVESEMRAGGFSFHFLSTSAPLSTGISGTLASVVWSGPERAEDP